MINMSRTLKCFLVPFLLLFAAGCMTSGAARRDRRVFEATERAAERALSRAKPSLVFFQIENPQARNQQHRVMNFSGIVLSEEGHLLAPVTLRPDSGTRVEAWVNEQRYLARSLRTDENLGMSILKIEPHAPLTPLKLEAEGELRPGQTAFTPLTTDESREFATFVFKSFCQGIIEGRYRQYSLSPLPDLSRGAPLFDSEGRLVGITSQSNAYILSDMERDIRDLLRRSKDDPEDGDDNDTEDAWFGAILLPVNTDYARLRDLPRSALWLAHVFRDSAAYRAGFRSGDLLIELNDAPLRLSGHGVFRYFLQTLRPRESKPFSATVLRDGQRIRGEGVLEKRPEPSTLRAEDVGITVSDIVESMVLRFDLFREDGVLITDVVAGSPAATGRRFGEPLLRNGDIVIRAGGHPTPDIEAFGRALDRIREERPTVLLVEFQRGATTGIEALNLTISKDERGE